MSLAHTLEAVARLHDAGLPVVPACLPLAEGRCSAGWHGVPCDSRGKRPLLKNYPGFAHERLSLEATIAHFRRCFPCNVGIVTGGRFIVVETDSQEGEVEVISLAEGPPVTLTRERRPGRGRGWIFRHYGGPVPLSAHGGQSGAIDVRGDSGFFIVPPSRHACGHVYEWAPGLALGEVEVSRVPFSLQALALLRADKARGILKTATSAVARQMKEERDRTLNFTPGISPRVAFLLKADHRLRRLWTGEGKSSGDCSRSGYDDSITRELLKRGVPPREVAEAIAVRPDTKSRSADYCWRTVQRAIQRGNRP